MSKVKSFISHYLSYFAGGDLSQRIEKQKILKKPFEEKLILKWFVQLCQALQHVHEQHIIHRDLNCKNIFLTKDGTIKFDVQTDRYTEPNGQVQMVGIHKKVRRIL